MTQQLTNFLWWQDHSVRSMVLQDGKVLIAPTSEVVLNSQNAIDCQGKLLLPKFIDAHCHILPTGLDLLKLNLSDCQTKEEVLDTVQDYHRSNPEGWLLAVQYDQTKFSDGNHISREQLDSISESRPILLRHYNGHCSVSNSAALTAADVTEDTANPGGGEYGRDANGRMNGVLLEDAHDHVWSAIPNPTLDEMVEAILRAGDKMSALGIGTASDMMTGRFDLAMELKAYQIAAERGCKIRTRLYVQWKEVFSRRGVGLEEFRELEKTLEDPNRTRIAGIKLFADGAIGSATAAIYGQYSGEPALGPVISKHGQKTAGVNTSGQLIYSPEKLTHMTQVASDAGYQVAIHAIGDYASDLVMDAFEATGDPARHRLEHAMILSDTQIERLANLNPYVTFQPEFLLRFGHAYRRQLGEERTSMLKRSRSLLDAGLRLSFNSDRPIVPGDPLDGIKVAVNRPEGFDSSENITLNESIRAYTEAGADVNGDSDLMGKLAEGELADYQLVEPNLFGGKS